MVRSMGMLAFGLVATALTAAADDTVSGLIDLVRGGLQRRQADSELAKSVAKAKLNTRLDHRVIEELESEGAGPETLDQLERLIEITATKPASKTPLPFAEPAAPTGAEIGASIDAARTYASHYSRSLPDFLCTEMLHRYEGPTPHGPWFPKDLLMVQVSYANQAENYKLVMVNNRPTNEDFLEQRGALTQGEFGTLMSQILDTYGGAEIRWDHWTHLRGRLTQVYSFTISPENSSYQLEFGVNGEHFSTTPGQAGLIYVDLETHAVVRLTRDAANLPAKFPVKIASTALDYDFAEIGDRRYFLPLRATIRMSAREFHTRNEIRFSAFRKFSTDATITFGDSAAPIKH